MTSPAQQAAAGDGTARGGDDADATGDAASEALTTGSGAVHGRRAATGRRAAGRAARAPRVLTTTPVGFAVELGERRAALARSRARASVLPTSRRSSFVASEPLVRAACGPEPVTAEPAPSVPSAPVPTSAPAARGPEASVTSATSVAPAPVPTAQALAAQTSTAQTPTTQTPTAQTPTAQAPTAQTLDSPVPSDSSSSVPVPGASVSAPGSRSTRRRGAAGFDRGRTRASGAVVAGRTRDSGATAVPLRDRALSVARKSVLVAAAVGLAASSVLPLLGGSGDEAQAEGTATPWHASGGQHVSVAGGVTEADASRDAYGATSLVDLATQGRRNATAALHTEYTGPTTADYLAAPLYDTLDRDQVLAVALQYLGTPYVHGGEDPSAFDCSGLVTFVYAQFGVDLVHYVPTQAAQGRVVPASEAVPGDLVVFDDLSHDGIYAGDGMILDAPRPGGFVDVRPIWDKAHHFVRIDG